ncbi:IS3 family transposase [Aneurinibacillus uraniidurans]|uniref:IS3 family transposase n=1 Tax=Aneurinibacillus uraniidurans TaxID=2966586 RepID=UPI003BEEE3A1
MAKKGQMFQRYTIEFKAEAVQLYEKGGMSYQAVADQLGIKSSTQVKQWVKKHRNDETFEDKRGKGTAWRKDLKKERFQVIRELSSAYRLCWLLTIAQVSRQQTEQKLKAHIQAIHKQHPYYGYLRMTVVLQEGGYRVNHKRVYRLSVRQWTNFIK